MAWIRCTSMPFNPPGQTTYSGYCLPCFESYGRVIDIVLYFVGFFANLYTMFLISMSLKRGSANSSSIPTVLLLALCITDFACLVLGELCWLIAQIHGTWLGGKYSYLYSVFVIATFTRLSRCIVVTMGLERYMSFKRPFVYDAVTTNKRVCGILLILTVYSLLVAGLYSSVVSGHMDPKTSPRNVCINTGNTSLSLQTTLESVYDYWTLIESGLLLLILVYCNVVVILCMRKLKIRITTVCPRNKAEYIKQWDMISGIPAEFSRLMVAITVLTLINIVPYEIRVLVNKFNVWSSPTADSVAVHLYLSIAIINPLLYVIFRRKSRHNIQRCLVRLFTCCPNIKIQPEESSKPTPNAIAY